MAVDGQIKSDFVAAGIDGIGYELAGDEGGVVNEFLRVTARRKGVRDLVGAESPRISGRPSITDVRAMT